MKAVEKEETIVWIPVKNIHPNKYNPNAMTEEQDAQLLEDMRQHGPNAIAPLDVRTDLAHDGFPHPIEEVQFEIIDGEHRWNHAVALGWERIRCVVKDMTLAEAKAANYRKNRERGTIDPFKEAELFKSESDEGLTQEEIAKKYGVDRSQVSKRISLLNIVPEVKKKVEKEVTHVTASHFEPIASLNPDLQTRVVEELKEQIRWNEEPTVEDIQNIASRISDDDKKERELRQAVAESKHQKCPKCDGDPTSRDWDGLPFVKCRKGHVWSLKSGKEKVDPWRREKTESKKEVKHFDGTLRSRHTAEEFEAVLGRRALSLIDGLAVVKEVSIRGRTKGGKDIDLDFNSWPTGRRINHVELGGDPGMGNIRLEADSKDFKEKDLKGFKTEVKAWPEPKNEKQLRKLSEIVEDLFRRFGKKRRVRKTKKRKKP